MICAFTAMHYDVCASGIRYVASIDNINKQLSIDKQKVEVGLYSGSRVGFGHHVGVRVGVGPDRGGRVGFEHHIGGRVGVGPYSGGRVGVKHHVRTARTIAYLFGPKRASTY